MKKLPEWLTLLPLGLRAVRLVWATSPIATLFYGGLTVIAGLLPAGMAWVGKHIVDAVVAHDADSALRYVLIEGGLVALMAAVQRGISVDESILRALLGFKVNTLILEKALTLGLPHFEDAAIYDKMTRARNQASYRPLSLVGKVFGLLQNLVSVVSYGGLLLGFSPLVVLVLALAAIPAFLTETKFSNLTFRLFKWRVPETRQQAYLETVIAREDYAKEVQLFNLGPLLLNKYKSIFEALFREDRALTLRRGAWGYLVSLLSTGAFYATYAWIALSTVEGRISLGEMTMYLLLFRQGQAALAASLSAIGGMYEDNLYLANLFEFLELPVSVAAGTAMAGPDPEDGLRLEGVTFTYPGASAPALNGLNLHLRPGQKLAIVGENGSGKTTLIKLISGLYTPQAGRILLDGLDLREWDPAALRARFAVIFQDFVRYQFLAGENIGAGDVASFGDEARWKDAARIGMADPFLSTLPDGYRTQLGRWFDKGRELSGGQWQKVALSRAFMRTQADILVLDEPTAAMDAEAEATIFAHFQAMAANRMVILISHRFSTVRMADHIVVIHQGVVQEEGSHGELIEKEGRYAHLFKLQAAGYQ